MKKLVIGLAAPVFFFMTAVAVPAGSFAADRDSLMKKDNDVKFDKDKGHEKKIKKHKKTSAALTPSGWSQGEKKGWEGSPEPPGFVKAKKQGWDDNGMPRGLAGNEGHGGGGHGGGGHGRGR